MRVSSLGFLILVYAIGLWRLWRYAGYGQGIRPSQALAFGLGWLSLVIALSPPLDEWSDEWLAAHMVQHELLMVVAAPLIAYGGPVIGLLWAMPSRVRRAAVAAVRRSRLGDAWTLLTGPGCVFVLYGAALWVWHVPVLYDYAVEHEGVHVLQHLCFFGTATLFWWGITHGRQGRAGYGAAVVYVFVTAVHGGVLGALLTISPHVWYAPYLSSRQDGLTPLEDQQLAGLLMWVPAGLAFAAGGLFLFAAWLRQSDRRSRFAPGGSPALPSTRTL